MMSLEAKHVPPPFIETPIGIATVAGGIVTAVTASFIIPKKTLVGR